LMWGTNNWAVQSASTIMAEMDLAVKEIRASGAEPIVYAIPPKDDNIALFGHANVVYAKYCIDNNVTFIDPWTSFRSSTGAWRSGASGDGGHPIVTAHQEIATNILARFPARLFSPAVYPAQTATDGINEDPFLNAAHNPFGAGSANAAGVTIAGSGDVLGNWHSLQLTNATDVVQASYKNKFGSSFIKDGDVLLTSFRVRVRDVVSASSWRWQIRILPGTGASWSEGSQYPTKGNCRNEGEFLFWSRNKMSGNPTQSFNPCRLEFWIDPMGTELTGKWEIAQISCVNLTALGIA
jgi:hypothetical protein